MGSDLWVVRERGIGAPAFEHVLEALPARVEGTVVDRIGPRVASVYLWRVRRVAITLHDAIERRARGDDDPRTSPWVEIQGASGGWPYVCLYVAHVAPMLDGRIYDGQDRRYVSVEAPDVGALKITHEDWVGSQHPVLCLQYEGGRAPVARVAEVAGTLGRLRDPPRPNDVYWTDTLELPDGARIGVSCFGTVTLRAPVDDAQRLRVVANKLAASLGIAFRPPVHQYELRFPR